MECSTLSTVGPALVFGASAIGMALYFGLTAIADSIKIAAHIRVSRGKEAEERAQARVDALVAAGRREGK